MSKPEEPIDYEANPWKLYGFDSPDQFLASLPDRQAFGYQACMEGFFIAYYGLWKRFDCRGENISALLKADSFFFGEDGFRKINAYTDTLEVVAALGDHNDLEWYTEGAHMYTIPTTEFVQGTANIIQTINPHTVLEAGAGDGALSQSLVEAGVSNLKAIDDHRYGGRKVEANTANRKIYPIVEEVPLDAALARDNPDFVIASWLVGKANPNDDVKLLEYPSVQNILWIGSRADLDKGPQHPRDMHGNRAWITSSRDFWNNPGWSYTEIPELSATHFNRDDSGIYGFLRPGEKLPRGNFQEKQTGKAILISRR